LRQRRKANQHVSRVISPLSSITRCSCMPGGLEIGWVTASSVATGTSGAQLQPCRDWFGLGPGSAC
jgi:hypothetical protein